MAGILSNMSQIYDRGFDVNHIINQFPTRFKPTSVVHCQDKLKEPDRGYMLNREREDHPTTISN